MNPLTPCNYCEDFFANTLKLNTTITLPRCRMKMIIIILFKTHLIIDEDDNNNTDNNNNVNNNDIY